MCSKLDLKALAEKYITLKRQENDLSKQTGELNKSIKSEMLGKDLASVDTTNGTLTLTKRESTSFDEEKLIAWLKESGHAKGIVKKKEYIDYDALESALYREKITEDEAVQMDAFKIVKVTNVLNIK